MLKNITLTPMQLYRLLNVIKELNPKLFRQIENETSGMSRVYCSYDEGGTYMLEFTDISYKPPILYKISWEPTSSIHNYIFYTTKRVD